MAEIFPFPACVFTLLVILIFIKIQSWMEYNGLPIPYISSHIGNLSSGFHFFDDEGVHLESPPDISVCIVDDDQESPDNLEKCSRTEKSRGFLALTHISTKTIRDRYERIRSSTSDQPLMINDVIISSFKDLISKIKEMIGDESEASIQVHDLLLKNVFQVTGGHVLGEGNVSSFEAREFYTTSASICYFLYHLSRDKELQSRIRNEIKGQISEIDSLGDVTIKEFTEKMPIFTAAILETCRLTFEPKQWSMTHDDRLVGLKFNDIILPKDTKVVVTSFLPSSKSFRLWGEDADIFNLERFMISTESGPQIDGNAVEKLVDENFGPFGSSLDKLFAFHQLMIGSALLLNAFEFSNIQQLGIVGSNPSQQSWLEIALTASLIVSCAKN